MTYYISKRGQLQKGFFSAIGRGIALGARSGANAVRFVAPHIKSGARSGVRIIQEAVIPRATRVARTVTEEYIPRARQYTSETAPKVKQRVKSAAEQARERTTAGAIRAESKVKGVYGRLSQAIANYGATPLQEQRRNKVADVLFNRITPILDDAKPLGEDLLITPSLKLHGGLHRIVDDAEHYIQTSSFPEKTKQNALRTTKRIRTALEKESASQGFVYHPIPDSHLYSIHHDVSEAPLFVPHDVRPLIAERDRLKSELGQMGGIRGRGASAPTEDAVKLNQQLQNAEHEINGLNSPDENAWIPRVSAYVPSRKKVLNAAGAAIKGVIGYQVYDYINNKIKGNSEQPSTSTDTSSALGKRLRRGGVSKMMGGKTGRMGPMPKDGDDDKGRYFQKGKYTKFYETDKQNNQMMNKSFMRNAKKFYEIPDADYYGKETAKKPNAIRKNNIGNSINMGGGMQNYGSYNPSMPNKKMMQMEPPRMKTPSPMGRPSLYTPPKPAGGSLKTFNPYPRAGDMATGMGAPTMKRMSKAQSKSSVGAKGKAITSADKNLMQQYIDAINNNATDQWGKGNVAGMWSKLIPSVMSHPLQPNKHAGAVVELSDMKNILGMGLLQQLAPQLINGGGLSVKASVYTPSASRGSATTKRMSKSITSVQRSGTRHVVGGLRGGSMAKRANTSNKYFK